MKYPDRMSQFIVSARKYRPQRFDQVVGQEHVTGTLRNALQQNHLAHAFLFCGPRGVGKTTCARILAKVLNCQNPTTEFEPCNTCSSCRAFNENASFNITELDAASNNRVEHIRALIEQVRFQPQQGKYKVFIIDEVHMLSQQAFNAFLKTLEEPPSYAIFILATTEKHKIIPTILSRCQIFDFRRIQVPDMVGHLQQICTEESITAEESALHVIAEKADGALRDALSIFDRMISFSGDQLTYEQVIDQLNVLDYDYYFQVTEALMTEDLSSILNILSEILYKGFEPDTFIDGLAAHFRNLLVCKDPQTVHLLELSDALKDRYRQQAELSPRDFLLSLLNLSNECDVHYRTARQKRLHVELYLMKMAYLNRLLKAAPLAPPEKKTPELSEPSNAPQPQTKKQKPETPNQKPETKNQSPENIPEQELQAPGSRNQNPTTNTLRKSRKSEAGAISLDISAVTEKVKNQRLEIKPLVELNLEVILKAWKTLTEELESKYVRAAMKAAKVDFDGKDHVLLRVGRQFTRETLVGEPAIIEQLRNKLGAPRLKMKVEVDEALAEKQVIKKPPKPLTVKEKYDKMLEINPLIQEMRKRFKLKADSE